jgi:DnaJ-class molecular chaperone
MAEVDEDAVGGEAICPACDGAGEVDGKPCEKCGGSGKVVELAGGA